MFRASAAAQRYSAPLSCGPLGVQLPRPPPSCSGTGPLPLLRPSVPLFPLSVPLFPFAVPLFPVGPDLLREQHDEALERQRRRAGPREERGVQREEEPLKQAVATAAALYRFLQRDALATTRSEHANTLPQTKLNESGLATVCVATALMRYDGCCYALQRKISKSIQRCAPLQCMASRVAPSRPPRPEGAHGPIPTRARVPFVAVRAGVRGLARVCACLCV